MCCLHSSFLTAAFFSSSLPGVAWLTFPLARPPCWLCLGAAFPLLPPPPSSWVCLLPASLVGRLRFFSVLVSSCSLVRSFGFLPASYPLRALGVSSPPPCRCPALTRALSSPGVPTLHAASRRCLASTSSFWLLSSVRLFAPSRELASVFVPSPASV